MRFWNIFDWFVSTDKAEVINKIDDHTYLRANGTVAIANIDTRALTRHLRTHGAQNGSIVALPRKSTCRSGGTVTARQSTPHAHARQPT